MNTDQINDLILKNISFSYYEKNNKKIILDNFNCKIKKGKFTSIIGPSGTGKSSLLKLIAGLMVPEKGEIKFENKTLIKVIDQITLIQQNPSLMPWLSVYDNIILDNSNNKKTNYKNIDKLIKNIGLGEFSSYFPHKLSGGLLQRVAIARALLFCPSLLLLDEPFAALDNLSREIISTELVSIIKKNSLTVLMVTHSIEEAALLSDEVLVTGMVPLRVINKFNPPKSFNNQSWQNLGLRKSLQDKSFNGYLKSIRDTSYSVLQKEK
jgi:NitT/TauT family transport system ATP-binding protein